MSADNKFLNKYGSGNPDDGKDDLDSHKLLEESLDETLADILEEGDQESRFNDSSERPEKDGFLSKAPGDRPPAPTTPAGQATYSAASQPTPYQAASASGDRSMLDDFHEDEDFPEFFAEDEAKENTISEEPRVQLKKGGPPPKQQKKASGTAAKTKSPLPVIGGAVLAVIVIVVLVLFLLPQLGGPRPQTIIFSIDPGDAEFFSGDTKLSPVKRKDGQMEITGLAPGTYTLSIRKKGYLQQEIKNVEISGKKVTQLGALALKKQSGNSLLCAVKPDDPALMVYINDEPVKTRKADDGRILIADLTPGIISVRVECKNYQSSKKEGIKIEKDSATELEPISLVEKSWRPIEIEVSPINVEVYVGAKKVATALNSRNILATDPLEPGIYRIQIMADGYESWNRKDGEVFSDISTSIGPLRLAKNQGGKIILECPDTAEFFIDDKKIVSTIRSDKRVEINSVKPGTYRFKVTREGKKEFLCDALNVPVDRAVELMNIPWNEQKGKQIILTVASGGASVSLDGVSKGKTSPVPGVAFILADVSVGAHTIKVEKEGFAPVVIQDIKVAEDTPAVVPVIAMKKGGALIVNGTPEEAEVQIEGAGDGQKAPCTFKNVPAGEVLIKVRKEGFKDFEKKVILKPEEEQTVEYKLQKSK